MKKTFISVLLAVCLVFTFMLTACTNNNGGNNPTENDPPSGESNVLVVYFSASGNTEKVANYIADATDGEKFELVPVNPYTSADLNYGNANSRVSREHNDESLRDIELVSTTVETWDAYNVIFIGYPIWWQIAAWPVNNFVKNNDFTGKTVIPFATSASSGLGNSGTLLAEMAGTGDWKEGRRFSSSVSQSTVTDWVNSLNLPKKPETPTTPVTPEQPETPVTPAEPTASLTYEKNGNAYSVTGETANVKNIVIPAEYEGLPVTVIKESAFAYSRHNEDIISVTIPDSVTTIERNAFYNRNEMTSVTIGENSKLAEIGNNAFSGNYALRNIYIPATVTTIGDSAFNNDSAIDFTVAQANSVYRSENGHLIEKSTNTLIRGGQNKDVPDSVTAIAQAAFRRSALTELNIPLTVLTIGNYIIANSSIAVINFAGTEEQWNAIGKGNMWNSGNRDVEVKFDDGDSNILIVYFTAESGNTERLANYFYNQIGGDVVKIEAAQPYTAQELNYSIQNNRPEVEKAQNARPEIAAATYNAIDMSKYDAVFIGYPIWWWTAPMIIGTFLEHYDLSGKDVYPFSQSASMNTTQFATSMEFVRNSAAVKGTPTVHDGLFARASSTSTIDGYLRTNGFIA